MKTRVISTEIWDEEKVFCLNIDTKLLYLVLLTNPYIGQSRFYKINDRQLSTFSGLNVEQIQKCKKDLEESKMVFFKEGYVCVTGYGFVECFYKGSKNEIAKQRELEKIPQDVFIYFKEKLDTLSIPYGYPSDTTINTKSEILNTKSGIIDKESFERFWESYPKKELKKKAKEIWLRKELGSSLKDILLFIEKAKSTDRWKKGYVKQPPAFLNGECWHDDITSYNDKNQIKTNVPKSLQISDKYNKYENNN